MRAVRLRWAREDLSPAAQQWGCRWNRGEDVLPCVVDGGQESGLVPLPVLLVASRHLGHSAGCILIDQTILSFN